MSDKFVEFENPDNLPVELIKLTVKNAGVVQNIKALDPYWVEKREMRLYEMPPSGPDLILGAVDTWRLKMECYLDDLKWLLSLQYYRFWSTILYHDNCMECLVSFLQEANPPYLPPHESPAVQKLYEEIRKFVLIVFSRLITNKESKSEWMSRGYMSEIIYNKFIFSIPILWDICLLYGSDNGQHVSRLLHSVFSLQPNYESDVILAIGFVNERFRYIILQVNREYESIEPPNLKEEFKGFSEIRRPSDNINTDKLTFPMLKDLVLHLLDIAMSLRLFIETYPKIVKVLRKTNLVNSIVQLYEYGIPNLYEKLEEIGDRYSVSYTEVNQQIDMARAELIDIFKEMLAVYKNAILNRQGDVALQVEDYLSLLLEGLSEKLLIQDYHASFPVHEDIDIIRQAYPNIDTVKTDFILMAIYSNLDEPVPERLLSRSIQNGHHSESEESEQAGPSRTLDTSIPDHVKQESMITEVKDILPHLGDGFILKCLEHYGFKPDRVINSILEGNLAESLKGIDQSLPIIPEDPLDQEFLATGEARLNVFDGDEFDIMRRDDVDLSRIHRGKRRSKYKDMGDMLNDKTDVRKLKDLYTKYSVVTDEPGMYSDEYDDAYDGDSGDGGGRPEPALPDDVRRPFVTPRALRHKEVRQHEEESSEGSSDEKERESSSSKNRMDFCVNPEQVRARRAAAMDARKPRANRPPPQFKTPDVVGKPRGQGQEKEVVVSRDKKEKHKSSRANHNRRQGAQWKRSQGMMPS